MNDGETVGFIIVAVRDDASRAYMGIDAASGGYEWWSNSVASARIYHTAEEAIADVARRMGESFLRGAAGVSFAYPARTVKVGVDRLLSVRENAETHRVVIDVPAGYVP